MYVSVVCMPLFLVIYLILSFFSQLLMRWDDPATSENEELQFAVNEMRQSATKGIVLNNALLMCIVEFYCTDDNRRNKREASEYQRRSSVNFILEACAEARRSGFINNCSFSAKAAIALRTLKANKECIRFVITLISMDSGKCKHKAAMEGAICAATEENDHISLQLMTDALKEQHL